jgi:hypothetical protein
MVLTGVASQHPAESGNLHISPSSGPAVRPAVRKSISKGRTEFGEMR